MFEFVKTEIKQKWPQRADVDGKPIPGGTGSFEVTVDYDKKQHLIHSKLKGDGRVDPRNIQNVLDKIERVVGE